MERFSSHMSEFKFACPVCGQHITADSGNTGSQLECPTCFRKIVVPQPPASRESKFILAASEVNKPRPRTTTPALEPIQRPPEKSSAPVMIAVLVVALCAAGAAVYAFRAKIFGPKNPAVAANEALQSETNDVGRTEASTIPASSNNVAWSLNLADAAFPESTPAGKIRGEYVLCNRSTLTGGALGFRQTTRGMPDLSVTVYFFAKQPEDLRGRKISVETNDAPVPKVVVRWKEGKDTRSQSFTNGYALKAELGEINGNHIPGRVYLSLPDEDRTHIAGTFNAEIKKPSPPKPRPKPGS
jgi:hypothetical protein